MLNAAKDKIVANLCGLGADPRAIERVRPNG
jgi:hypothetical protein